MNGYLDVEAQLLTHPNIERRSGRSPATEWVVAIIVLPVAAVFLVPFLASASPLEMLFAPVLICVALLLGVGIPLALGWRRRALGRRVQTTVPRVSTFAGDAYGVWALRDSGAPLSRLFSHHWNSYPELTQWLYDRLRMGDLQAILHLGQSLPVNFGELYVAVYAAPERRVAFLVLSSRSARQAGFDTGWRPIELRDEWYDYASRFFGFADAAHRHTPFAVWPPVP